MVFASPNRYVQFASLYLHLEQPTLAIQTLESARIFLPQDRQILRQLAEIYDATAQSAQANKLWDQLANNADDYILLGDEYLEAGKYTQALRWYQTAIEDEPTLKHSLAFSIAIATIVTKDEAAEEWLHLAQSVDTGLQIYNIGLDEVQFDASELRWLQKFPSYQIRFGTPLRARYETDESVGIFWWSGQAVFIVNSKISSNYDIEVRILNSTPPPVEIAIGQNSEQEHFFSLSKGDNSWQTVHGTISIDAGLHVLSVWFLNNQTFGNEDRDAILDSIIIRPAES